MLFSLLLVYDCSMNTTEELAFPEGHFTSVMPATSNPNDTTTIVRCKCGYTQLALTNHMAWQLSRQHAKKMFAKLDLTPTNAQIKKFEKRLLDEGR